MLLTFVYTSRFAATWSAARLTDDDLQRLERELMDNPEAGAVLAGTGGVRKVRFAPPSRHTGKRGAFRVGYALFRAADTVYLLAVFGKNERANFTGAERAALRDVMKVLTDHHRADQ